MELQWKGNVIFSTAVKYKVNETTDAGVPVTDKVN
jgi:hypothetical protein